MKNQKGPPCREAGQAAILIVFVLGMISLFVGISLVQTGFAESLMGRANPLSAKAFYIANSGIEEALYKLTTNPAYGAGLFPGDHFDLSMSEGQTSVDIYTSDPVNNPDQRTIESAGKSGSYIRKIKTVVGKGSTLPGFDYAVQDGSGGIKLVNGVDITGNVYSKTDITGKNNNCQGSSGSKINGQVQALGTADTLCINGDYQVGTLINSNTTGNIIPPPIPINELPTINLSLIQTYVNKFPPFPTACEADGSNGSLDCTQGSKELGNILINGDLNIKSDLTFIGPVWVTGSVYFDKAGSIIKLSDEINNNGIGQIVVAQQKIIVNARTDFVATGGVFILLISDYDPGSLPDLCTDPSININANVNSILFYAPRGCLKIDNPTASSTFTGSAVGVRISVERPSTINFNYGLVGAVFGLTRNGGWQTISFKEE